jgi:hypothetical protein
MQYTAAIRYLLRSGSAHVQAATAIMASLDCAGCKRTHCTVVFPAIGSGAYCTPTSHEFSGSLIQVARDPDDADWVIFQIAYDYDPFTDTKYSIQSSPQVTWARVTVQFSCARCRASIVREDQSNMSGGKPVMCQCGSQLGNLSHAFKFGDAQQDDAADGLTAFTDI